MKHDISKKILFRSNILNLDSSLLVQMIMLEGWERFFMSVSPGLSQISQLLRNSAGIFLVSLNGVVGLLNYPLFPRENFTAN